MLILLGMALVGPALSDDDDRRRLFLVPAGRRPRPLQQLLRPLIGGALAGRPLIGGKNLISNFRYLHFKLTHSFFFFVDKVRLWEVWVEERMLPEPVTVLL